MTTTRTAKLFVAGEYPDKGLKVETEDLQRLAKSFKEIPVKVEHTDTVFDGKIGRVREVWCSGDSLYGTIEFDQDMWALIDKIGAKSLSVGIREDLSALTEVSIVKTPRVADARIFCVEVGFDAEVPAIEKALREENDRLKEELARVRSEGREKEAADEITALLNKGALTAASVPYAKTLLLWDGVKFGKGETVCEVFRQFCRALPCPTGSLHEENEPRAEFGERELEVLKGLGADPERVAKNMEAKHVIR